MALTTAQQPLNTQLDAAVNLSAYDIERLHINDTVTKCDPIDWEQMPVEALLEIASHVPFSPKNFINLLLVNKRLTSILKTYQRSLSNTISASQFPQLAAIFPCQESYTSFKHLAMLLRRQATIDSILAKTGDISYGTFYPLRESLPQWQRLLKCGLYLLYQLHDLATHESKSHLLATLPVGSLSFVNLVMVMSTKLAEDNGTGVIHSSYARNNAETRADISLVFSELCLRHGPEFIVQVLRGESLATNAVYWEWKSLDEYQIHEPGKVRKRTLGSLMREAFARRCGCPVHKVGGRLWGEAQKPVLWGLREGGVLDMLAVREEMLEGWECWR